MIIFGGLLTLSAKILINVLLIEALIWIFKNCKSTLKEIIRNRFEWLSEVLKKRREG